MFRCFRSLLVIVAVLSTTAASAHESWISRGGHKNAAGEWCCGVGDCFVIPGQSVSTTAQGYRLFGSETVPYSEAQPSPDGASNSARWAATASMTRHAASRPLSSVEAARIARTITPE